MLTSRVPLAGVVAALVLLAGSVRADAHELVLDTARVGPGYATEGEGIAWSRIVRGALTRALPNIASCARELGVQVEGLGRMHGEVRFGRARRASSVRIGSTTFPPSISSCVDRAFRAVQLARAPTFDLNVRFVLVTRPAPGAVRHDTRPPLLDELVEQREALLRDVHGAAELLEERALSTCDADAVLVQVIRERLEREAPLRVVEVLQRVR